MAGIFRMGLSAGKGAWGRLRCLFLLCALLLPAKVLAQDVLIVQSGRLQAYADAAQALELKLRASVPVFGPKQVEPATPSTLLFGEETTADELRLTVRSRRPRVVVAVGSRALSALLDLAEFPLVYLLAPNAQQLAAGHPNVTGVTLDISPKESFRELLALAPLVKRIAVVHDPGRTASLIAEGLREAAKLRLTLEVREARSAAAVPSALGSMPRDVDALWMVPDATVTSPDTVEAMILFSVQRRVPILTFADKYLSKGATLAVTFDAAGLGSQAGEVVRKILAGTPPRLIPVHPPDQVNVRVNEAVAAKLGLRREPAR